MTLVKSLYRKTLIVPFLPTLLAFWLELVRHYEIRPQSRPKVFFKGFFESCSLEINQLLVN
jgi:hypothetical protein